MKEQKWHFSQWEENKQKRNRGKQQIKPVRTRRFDESLGTKGRWEGQGQQLTLMALCCFVLSSGKWYMGLVERNLVILGLFIIRGYFLIVCFLLRAAGSSLRMISPGDWALGSRSPQLALAACRIRPPPSRSSYPVSHTLVISGDPVWPGV